MDKPEYSKYKGRKYKYILDRPFTIVTGIHPLTPIKHPYFTIGVDSVLKISNGYAWDGATGVPSLLQTKKLVRPSLVHDVFCQAIEEGYLSKGVRKEADKLFRVLCEEEGMPEIVVTTMYKLVRGYVKVRYIW